MALDSQVTISTFTDSGPCWVCDSPDMIRIHEALLDFAAFQDQDPELASYTGQRVWLRRCRACGFAQPERLPSLTRYFERMYDQRWSAEWIAAEFDASYKDWIFTDVLTALDRRVATPGRTLLDIGAHVGRFLDLARRHGWNPVGVELNPRTAAYAAERTGVPVHRLNAHELASLGRPFDAATLIDVLEHIPRPVELLTSIRTLLKPAGWLVVKVPCGPAQRLKERVRARTIPGYRATLADNLVHVNHFSPRALRLALTRAGFGSVAIGIAAPEVPAAAEWRGQASNALRIGVYHAGRVIPGAVHTPLALNLQAYARVEGIRVDRFSARSATSEKR